MPEPERVTVLVRRLVAVLAAALVTAEVALVGWWAVTSRTVVFALLQLLLAMLAGSGALVWRYHRVRRDYERGIADAAIAWERARLAEELHDALGHDLSVIALRAGAVQVHAAGEVRDHAAALRHDVEQAVARLRETVEVLHGGARERAPYDPATETVPHLLTRMADSGVDVKVTGRVPDHLPRIVEHTVAGVVREGLTNATRHAPGTPVRAFAVSDGWLRTTITNDTGGGATATARPGNGSGIAALRRRVAALGGEVDSGVDGEAHVLTAQVPLRGMGRVVAPASAAPRATTARTPLRAVALPAAVALLAVLGFYSWSTYAATLEEHEFASVRIGDAEAVTRARMPARQSPVRLATPRPRPHGWACTAYSDGNFPLGMAVFEICYHDGRVVQRTDLRDEDLR
jgi:signal transduction histidine kinase